jgi:MSHA pilin protein MshD
MRTGYKQSLKQTGISLIELIIFIVILSIALTGITLVYINTTRYGADPMVRIRSIELAQSTLEEVLLKAYDDNTPIGGGCVQMSNAATTLCASGDAPASDPDAAGKPLGAEEASRILFDDVDDYHSQLYCGQNVVPANTACPALTCQPMQDGAGNNIAPEYQGFSVCIQLSYAGNELNTVAPGTGTNVGTNDAKRIDVIVSDSLHSRISLSAYRLNF